MTIIRRRHDFFDCSVLYHCTFSYPYVDTAKITIALLWSKHGTKGAYVSRDKTSLLVRILSLFVCYFSVLTKRLYVLPSSIRVRGTSWALFCVFPARPEKRSSRLFTYSLS